MDCALQQHLQSVQKQLVVFEAVLQRVLSRIYKKFEKGYNRFSDLLELLDVVVEQLFQVLSICDESDAFAC